MSAGHSGEREGREVIEVDPVTQEAGVAPQRVTTPHASVLVDVERTVSAILQQLALQARMTCWSVSGKAEYMSERFTVSERMRMPETTSHAVGNRDHHVGRSYPKCGKAEAQLLAHQPGVNWRDQAVRRTGRSRD